MAVEAPIVEAPQAVPITGVQTPQSVAAEARTAPLATDLAQAFAEECPAEEAEDVFLSARKSLKEVLTTIYGALLK